MSQVTFSYTLEQEEEDQALEVLVTATYYPAEKSWFFDGRGGPPIDQPEPAFCELDSVTRLDANGVRVEVELSDDEEDRLCDEALAQAEGAYYDE